MLIQVFEYVEELDAFKVTPQLSEICGELGLNEWGIGPVFIGRYLCMDNDFGEHFSDNWDEREEHEEAIKAAGYEDEDLLFVNPERFQNQHDGPCHSPKMRKMFWTDLFKSLKLSSGFLFEEARRNGQRCRRFLKNDPDAIHDLEDRIKRIKERLV